MKKTNFKDKDKYKIGEVVILIFIIVFIVCIMFLLLLRKLLDNSFINIFIIFSSIPVVLFGMIYIGILYGKIRVKKKELLMKKDIILDNPYIYYRELPNNYGIGISSILMDKTIENDKDIIACILDLCARGYLRLDNKVINVLDKDYSNLLSNEVYIMDNIVNNKVGDINYQTWHDLCVKDSKELELFEDYVEDIADNKEYNINNKACIIVVLVISIILSFLTIIVPSINNNLAIFIGVNNTLIFKIISFICVPFISFGILIYACIIIKYLFLVGKSVYDYKESIYNNTLTTKLIYTSKGINEVKKLLSFKEFLKDFGDFKYKNLEEIILWEEYLSYAIMFNLTKDILKTGYKKLIDNSSFKIDNINNLDLNNISVNK